MGGVGHLLLDDGVALVAQVAGAGEDAGGAAASMAAATGKRGSSLATISSSCSLTVAASGWAKIVRIAANTISALPFGIRVRTLRRKWTRQTPSVNLRPLGGHRHPTIERRIVGLAVEPTAPEDPAPAGANGASRPTVALTTRSRGVVCLTRPGRDPDRGQHPLAPDRTEVVVRRVAESDPTRRAGLACDRRARPASAKRLPGDGKRVLSSPISASSVAVVTSPVPGKLANRAASG